MKSNFKRAIASISTIALAASTFAGFSVTASAAGTNQIGSIPTGVNKVEPYSYPAENIDYGIGGVQAGTSYWTANADADTVTFTNNRTGVHYTDIDNENYLGYAVNKIIIPRKSGFTSGTLYILKNVPPEESMNNAASGAFTRNTGIGVKSFINVENQIFGHENALEDVNNPTVLTLDQVIARVTLNGGNSYTVTAGSNGIAKTETKSTSNIEITINTTEDADGFYTSNYQDDDLMIYGVNAPGTFGPLQVNFRTPSENIDIEATPDRSLINTADYYSDHNEGIYYIGRANTVGLKSIDVKGDGQNADTIVKIFALTNKLAGEDEKKDFLHDYTHKETGTKGVYKNVKYQQLGKDVVIPAGSNNAVSTGNFTDSEVGTKFIYAVIMKKVPAQGGTSNITETGTDTAPIEQITYHYVNPNRYANAIKAEWLLLNTEVEDVVDDDYDLIPNYDAYQQALQDRVTDIQNLRDAGKTENVFTETYAAKWGKILDEKEAMEDIVKQIYDEITTQDVIYTRDPSSEHLRNAVNEIWQSYTRASIAGKSYVKRNNYDELEDAHNKLLAFYDSVIADYIDSIDAIYDRSNNSVKLKPYKSNNEDDVYYLDDEGHKLDYLNWLIDSGQYDYDKANIAKKVTEAIDPDKGGIDVIDIVNDANNVVSTYYNVSKIKFDELYEAFVAKYEAANLAGDAEGKKKAIDEATELSNFVDAIESSAFAAEIREAIGKDYRYAWANKVDNFNRFRARSAIADAARDLIKKTAEAKVQIDNDQIAGISARSFDNIIEKYWDASQAAEKFDIVCGPIPEANEVLDEFDLLDDVVDAKKNLNESYDYVTRAAEIITADVRAALDDIADDPGYNVEPVNATVANIVKEFTKFKYIDTLYAAAMAHPHIETFLGGFMNEYFPFAQVYQFGPGTNTLVRSHDAADAIDYVAMYEGAKNLMQAYYDEAKAQVEALYAQNIDTLKDDIATLSFRDIVFDNFQSKYNDMSAVNDKMKALNDIIVYHDCNLSSSIRNNISTTDIKIKNNETDITTEALGNIRQEIATPTTADHTAKDHEKYTKFNSLLINQYKMLMDKIKDLSTKDKALLTAIQNLINELAKGDGDLIDANTKLADFAIGQPNTRELVEDVEDYIINTLPDPSKTVDNLLTRVDTAITNHKTAKRAYDNAYTSVYNDIETKKPLHEITDYTTGNNSQDDPGANNAPDYYYDLDPLKYTGVYFTKRDVDAWDLRLRPPIETALDARAGYDAKSIADTMLMIPDADITAENYHDFDDTVIPAHELFERARNATQTKIRNDYKNAYDHYLAKWNQYVAANNEVANKITEFTNKAETEANAIIDALVELYNKVTDPETVYETVEQVEEDIAKIEELEKRIDDDIKDVNDEYTYLNRNYFNHVFKLEDFEAPIWTIESILDDWDKSIPVINRAKYDLENLDIVDDLDETNAKVGYKVVVGDEDADEEITALIGDFNTIRDHGGTMVARTAYDLLDEAVNDAMSKYRVYRYATDNFGTPAYKLPPYLNFLNVDNPKDIVEGLYNIYRGPIAPDPVSFFDAAVHNVIEQFFMDEVEKVNRFYDVLYIKRPAGTWFGEMSDYEAALEFNEDLKELKNGTSTMDGNNFYEKYLELLANHPKAVPFLFSEYYQYYLDIVGARDESGLLAFTNAVKALDYGSYANPWGKNLVYKQDHKTPDDVKSEEEYQAAYDAVAALYDALSSNAKDAIADPEANNKIQQDASKAFELFTESIPAWHTDFVNGYKDAAIASGYAAIANNYKGIITEANYKEALAAYNDAVDARTTLDKYPAHNMYQAEATNIRTGTPDIINPNFDDLTDYPYAYEYESDITEGLTATLKSAIGEQLANTAAVMAIESLINKIGVVTVDSGEAIATARLAYEALSPSYQSQVKNYSVLLAAEKAYADLDEVKNAKSYAGPAIEAIDAIGTVTRQSGDAIKDARAKYDALSELSKSFVSNYNELTKAEADFAKLEKASGDVTGDGKIGIADVNMVLQSILGNVILTDAQKVAADVNQDGKINVLDLVAMVALW